MKAVFLDRMTFPTELTVNVPEQISTWENYDSTQPAQVIGRCHNADIIFVNKVLLQKKLLKQLPDLKLICITATGTNNVDLIACKELGIGVVNATGYGVDSVAEHALMLMLTLSKNLKSYLIANDQKSWSKSEHFCDRVAPIQTLAGKTLTIIGAGTLGKAVVNLATVFGMNVIISEKKNALEIRPGYTEFNQAINAADILSLHCPLTEDTFQLINKETLAKMKNTAILINTGRGDLINEDDLLSALISNEIAAAGLDVTKTEPPEITDTIWKLSELPNVIITPHVAWASFESMTNLINQITDKLTAFLTNEEFEDLTKT